MLSEPADKFVPVPVSLNVPDEGLPNPILIDVRTGSVTPLGWKGKGVFSIPLNDSVVAVADASYLGWPAVPETPTELRVTRKGNGVKLEWKTYDQVGGVEVQRSVAYGP